MDNILRIETKPEEYVLNPYCKLYLPLDKLDGLAIKSEDAYGHLCTASGTEKKMDGRYFDGNDYITLPSGHRTLFGISDFSFVIWCNPKDWTDSTLFGYGAGSTTESGVWVLFLSTTLLRVNFNDNQGLARISKNFTIPDVSGINSVHFIVINFDRDGNVELFFDLVSCGTQSISSRPNSCTLAANSCIGSYAAGGGSFFSGTISEISENTKLLSLPERRQIYQTSKWRHQ